MRLKTLLTTELENINRKNDCSMLIFKDAFKKKTQYLPWHSFSCLFVMTVKEISIILLIFVLLCCKGKQSRGTFGWLSCLSF